MQHNKRAGPKKRAGSPQMIRPSSRLSKEPFCKRFRRMWFDQKGIIFRSMMMASILFCMMFVLDTSVFFKSKKQKAQLLEVPEDLILNTIVDAAEGSHEPCPHYSENVRADFSCVASGQICEWIIQRCDRGDCVTWTMTLRCVERKWRRSVKTSACPSITESIGACPAQSNKVIKAPESVKEIQEPQKKDSQNPDIMIPEKSNQQKSPKSPVGQDAILDIHITDGTTAGDVADSQSPKKQKREIPEDGCHYAGPYPESFLYNHADPDGRTFKNLEDAQKVCDNLKRCAGVTASINGYQPRRGPDLVGSSNKETSWMRECPWDNEEKTPAWKAKLSEMNIVEGIFENFFDGSTAGDLIETDVETYIQKLKGDTRVIYFFRTNYPAEMPGRPQEKKLKDLTLCAIESVATLNPDFHVLILSNSLEEFPERLLKKLSNIHIVSYNATSISDGMPIEEWYHAKIWHGGFAPNNLANGLRMALIYKYGGMYMDSDIISVQQINQSVVTGPIDQGAGRVNNAVLAFWEPGSEFLMKCMKRFVQDFDPAIWGHNGPDLMSRVYFDVIRKNQTLIPRVAYHIIPWFNATVVVEPLHGHTPWYDTTYQWGHRYFNASHLWDTWMKDGYGVHLYNALIKHMYGRVPTDSVLWNLFDQFCPDQIAHSSIFAS